MEPIVSVVIPVYNYAHTLAECIDSVAAQELGGVEIIVVDDASTDDTFDVVKSFDIDGLVYVAHPENRGVSAAQATGLRAARAPYVGLLGADDAMTPENLLVKVGVLERHADLGLVHSGATLIDERGRTIRKAVSSQSADAVQVQRLWPHILGGNSIVASSVVARAEAIAAVGGFDPELRYAEDWDLWIRLSRRYRFAYVPRPLVLHRIHASSMQWRGFAAGEDLAAAEQILRKAFAQMPLEEEGLSFDELYGRTYFAKLGNKIDVLPIRVLIPMYLRGLVRFPRQGFSRPGLKASAKIAARAIFPQKVLRRARVQRHARRVEGVPPRWRVRKVRGRG